MKTQVDARKRNDIDAIISKRIVRRRHEAGITLMQLAAKTGVTYQQIQKYEKAINRVPASRLFLISLALDRDLGYFYYGARAAAKKMLYG